MKFTINWLKEHLDTKYNENKIVEKLTDIGLEVESFENISSELDSFKIAKVIDAQQHPNADRLKVCDVDIGQKDKVKVVCGASNAKKDLLTVYASPGSIIPKNKMQLSVSKIRGVTSYGMLCSEAELNLSNESDGIKELSHNKYSSKIGENFFIGYSPEREDPNNPKFTTTKIPKVIGADSEEELIPADLLYSTIVDQTVLVKNTKTAEATKLMENIFRSVNIAMVNEMKLILDKMGIDVWEVIEAANTKPFGFMRFDPGPGLGGHCIPIDPFYLAWKAREFGIQTQFIKLAGEINLSMPDYVFQKVLKSLNKSGKNLKDSRILILGVAYKRDIDDCRESPSFNIMELLTQNRAQVDYNDPFVPEIGPRREFTQFVGKKTVSLEHINSYDLTLILTDHSIYDYEKIVEESKIVVDTRNACSKIKSEKIIKA